MLFANSDGLDEREHPCSLIWTFPVNRHILQYPFIMLADNVGPDQPPVRMRKLISAFVVRKLQIALEPFSCVAHRMFYFNGT